MSRKDLYNKKRYAVFACYHCHQWQYSNMFQKTHQCVACRRILAISKVNPAFETDKVDEAAKYLQELKKRMGLKRGWGDFVSADKLRKAS